MALGIVSGGLELFDDGREMLRTVGGEYWRRDKLNERLIVGSLVPFSFDPTDLSRKLLSQL